jgi:hypothetical protein
MLQYSFEDDLWAVLLQNKLGHSRASTGDLIALNLSESTQLWLNNDKSEEYGCSRQEIMGHAQSSYPYYVRRANYVLYL